MKSISLVIPAYNEEHRIGNTLKAYHSFLSKKYKDFEIIVVTDGITDGTEKITKDIAAKRGNIRLLKFKERLGKGGAVLKGFKAAKGEIIGFTDADSSVSPKEFNKLLIALPDYDCVAGSRYAKGAIQLEKQPPEVRAASRAFNLIVNLLFGLDMKDTQCGGKVFRKDILKKVVPKMITTDFSFDVELLWRVDKIGRVKEEPLIWEHEADNSKSALRNSPKMFLSLIKARLSG